MLLPVQLVHYQTSFYSQLSRFSLSENQLAFTSLPIKLLANLTTDQLPVVITYEEKPAGFFLLNNGLRVNEYTSKRGGVLLTSLSIDTVYQGMGIASEAIKQLPLFISGHFHQCKEVVLAVNMRNTPAQKLYIKAGFEDTGRRKMGPIGEQMIMSLTVN
ncbi:GNAT family N-acetyltransferase [Bacillus sp. A301a_S52]|jgi:ribosomal protein S18 acetylase RimI-like enzyme|nr:GNAT family N-acetyltransferase [Bacillus sp. A301a_S52]